MTLPERLLGRQWRKEYLAYKLVPTELKKHLSTLSSGTHRNSTDVWEQPEVLGSHDNMIEDRGRKARFGYV